MTRWIVVCSMLIGIEASAQQDRRTDASERDEKPYARNLLSLGVVPFYFTWYFRQNPPVDMGGDNKIDEATLAAMGLSASYVRRLSRHVEVGPRAELISPDRTGDSDRTGVLQEVRATAMLRGVYPFQRSSVEFVGGIEAGAAWYWARNYSGDTGSDGTAAIGAMIGWRGRVWRNLGWCFELGSGYGPFLNFARATLGLTAAW